MLLDVTAYRLRDFGCAMASDRLGPAAQASAVASILSLIGLGEKGDVRAARTPGRTGRAAVYASRRHCKNKVSIVAGVAGQNGLPAQILILFVILVAAALLIRCHLYRFRQVEYRIGCHNVVSLGQRFLADHPDLAVKANFLRYAGAFEIQFSVPGSPFSVMLMRKDSRSIAPVSEIVAGYIDHELRLDAATFAEECRHDEPRRVAGNRQRESLRRQNHRGVHADDRAARGHQGTAGISRIQCGIRLNDVLHEPARTRAHRSPDGADDAARHRVLKTVRIADRDDDLAGTQGGRIPEMRPRQSGRAWAIDAKHGKVGIRIVADKIGAAGRAIEENDGYAARAFDDVAIGDNEAVGCEQEAGSGAARLGLDLDDGGTSLLDGVNDGAGIAVKDLAIVREIGRSHRPIVGPRAPARTTRSGSLRRRGDRQMRTGIL